MTTSDVLESVARKWVQKTAGTPKKSDPDEALRALQESFEEVGVSLSLEDVKGAMSDSSFLTEQRPVPLCGAT